jgi:hypothetical protein
MDTVLSNFKTLWLDKRFILYGDGGIHTVDELTQGYHTYFDYLDEHNKNLPSPGKFINDLVFTSCDLRHKELITEFLARYYEPKEYQVMLEEISWYTITDTNKYIARFKIRRYGENEKYYVVVKEYMFANNEFDSRRYNLSLYRLEGKEKYTYIQDQTNFSRGECERSIRNCIKSRKQFDIKWYEVDLNV